MATRKSKTSRRKKTVKLVPLAVFKRLPTAAKKAMVKAAKSISKRSKR